jgi:hypothetical protein
MDLSSGVGTRHTDIDRAPTRTDDAPMEFTDPDATPGGTPIPRLAGPAADPVDPVGVTATGWLKRVVPLVGGVAAAAWAVQRLVRRR